ncbi:hypothetical protein HDU78_000511 [Chytriomyces hyalinus]|nr:hypothetical protein HDU78_000511 [Chytriomyces hyalinus]
MSTSEDSATNKETCMPGIYLEQQKEKAEHKKGRCWCCWETCETRENALIRVCRGCKDPDLQFIHQQCIDAYLSKLPPREDDPDDLGMNNQHWDNPNQVPRQERAVRFSCSRCKDAYIVYEKPVALVTAVMHDAYLSRAVLLLLLSTLVVFLSCSYSWYYETFVVPQKLMFDVWLPFGHSFQLGLTFFAGLMLCLCYFLCVFTYYLLKDFFKSEVSRHVKAAM